MYESKKFKIKKKNIRKDFSKYRFCIDYIDDFKLFNLHNTLFQNYFTLPLIDSHLNFRYKSRNELKYKAFRKLLRPLYNILHSKKIGIGKFYKQENYGNLLLVPKNKFEEILTIFS